MSTGTRIQASCPHCTGEMVAKDSDAMWPCEWEEIKARHVEDSVLGRMTSSEPRRLAHADRGKLIAAIEATNEFLRGPGTTLTPEILAWMQGEGPDTCPVCGNPDAREDLDP